MQEPKRRVQITLDLSADAMGDAATALRHIVYEAERGQLHERSHTGPSTSFVLRVHENPDQTHEKYHAELDAYLAHLRTQSNEAAVAGRRDGADVGE